MLNIYSQLAAAAESRQSCLTLCDPTDGSPPGSPVPGILRAKTLECARSVILKLFAEWERMLSFSHQVY